MSTQRTRREASSSVLVFGEDLHDSKSIAALLVAANPRLDRRVKAVPRPTSLTRDAKPDTVRDWVDELSRTVRGYKATGTRIAAILVHRDADGPDPTGAEEEKLGRQVATVPAHPIVPVQMIEAWWFLFPDAVESVRPHAWRGKMPRKARDVEAITNPKPELTRITGRGNRHPYTEADSIAIAEAIRRLQPAQIGTSASYDRFLALARQIP